MSKQERQIIKTFISLGVDLVISAALHLNLMGKKGKRGQGRYCLLKNLSAIQQEAVRDTCKLGLLVLPLIK